jgi:hypothetical protein
MIYLRDAHYASVKADDLLKALANAEHLAAERLTVEQRRAAASDLLACAQMIATHEGYETKAQTLAALAVAHSAVAGIPEPTAAWPPAEPR